MDQPHFVPPISDVGASAWPRRAAKACASCRRDKIRCDGERPCGGCVKKGFSANECTDGCEHCRRARVRCQDGNPGPCVRCREKNLECVEEVTTPPVRQESNSTARAAATRAPPRDGTHERARLACQNCRRDNKKCDDERPCQRCIARSEECVHVGRGPKQVKLRCEACRKDNKKCEDVRPCKSCLDEGKECINIARKGRGHGTRVKAACTNCRRDKIRCDGARPCGTCTRKKYDCVDRACKACIQKGLEADCTHRQPPEVISDHDESAEKKESESNPAPPPSTSFVPTGGPPPQLPYAGFPYQIQQFYTQHYPQANAPPGQHPIGAPHIMPIPTYTADGRPAAVGVPPGYSSVIDPQIAAQHHTMQVSMQMTQNAMQMASQVQQNASPQQQQQPKKRQPKQAAQAQAVAPAAAAPTPANAPAEPTAPIAPAVASAGSAQAEPSLQK